MESYLVRQFTCDPTIDRVLQWRKRDTIRDEGFDDDKITLNTADETFVNSSCLHTMDFSDPSPKIIKTVSCKWLE